MIQLSAELHVLVQMVQQELCQNDTRFDIAKIDWHKFRKNSTYHGLRPIVFAANQKQSILPEQIRNQFKNFTQRRAWQNLENVIEIKRLYDLFIEQGIKPVLLKGVLFTTLLYQNQVLREGTDIDFLFQREDALKGIEILLADGYVCRDLGVLANAKDLKRDLNQLIFETDFQELHFDKNGFNIDFHWELCNQFLNFKVDLELFFKDLDVINFYGKEIRVTNPNALFWSLVVHHGGKELWLKFKNLVDLIAFLERYKSEIDWKHVIRQAKDFNMLTSLKTGIYLIKHVFDYPIPDDLEKEIHGFKPKKLDQIVAFWEDSKYWNKIIPRWRYEKILHYSQDEGYTLIGYFHKLYKTYSLPNPFEHKRIFNFPAAWTFLNFLDKLLSYLFRKR